MQKDTQGEEQKHEEECDHKERYGFRDYTTRIDPLEYNHRAATRAVAAGAASTASVATTAVSSTPPVAAALGSTADVAAGVGGGVAVAAALIATLSGMSWRRSAIAAEEQREAQRQERAAEKADRAEKRKAHPKHRNQPDHWRARVRKCSEEERSR